MSRELHLTEEAAAALAGVSQSLFNEEAEAVVECMAPSERVEGQLGGLLSSDGVLAAAGDPVVPLVPPREAPGEVRADQPLPHDDMEDALAALLLADWAQSAVEPQRRAKEPEDAVAAPWGTRGSSDALAVQWDRRSPSSNLRHLLTLGNELPSGCDALSKEWMSATELLLQGLDAKAVLDGNVLQGIRLRHKCVSQVDFSFTGWEGVHAEHCDFSHSLFYKGFLKGPCIFERCTFDGAILNGLSISRGEEGEAASVRFVDCSFRRASLGLVCALAAEAASPSSSSSSSSFLGPYGPLFTNCDFDLASFEGCVGLAGHPEAFQGCINVETAARFPLRVREVSF